MKALDRIVREVVLGFDCSVRDQRRHLIQLGLTSRQVDWVIEFVAMHGPMLQSWGVREHTIKMIRLLHSSSWFAYADLDSAIITRVGGRQGCQFGSTIFNSAYAITLVAMRDELMKHDIVMHIRSSDDANWTAEPCEVSFDGDATPVIDVAFVDDECIFIAAASPAVLDAAINVVLGIIVVAFDDARLEINWKPGKTECLLGYRGRRSSARLDARRIGAHGSLAVRVPGEAGMVVSVVDSYKHLGVIVQANGGDLLDGQARFKSAMGAYTPLAMRIFASRVISPAIKFILMWSLVMSRLLFNAHVRTPTARLIKLLNGVYMRPIRRIVDVVRHGHSVSDLEARTMARAPSIDCVLVRARLRYFARLMTHRHPSVLAVVFAAHGDQRSPWLRLVIDDMKLLRARVSLCSRLPDPSLDSAPWIKMMRDDPAGWSNAIGCMHFSQSVCDARVDRPAHVEALVLACKCDRCEAAFPTQRALMSHMRAKHKVRARQRFYAGADAVCVACGTAFHTRLRLLAHLCDRRRTKCWQAIMNQPDKFPPLPGTEVEALDDLDREARRLAWKAGHTHPVAVGSAVTSGGKRIGHVSR